MLWIMIPIGDEWARRYYYYNVFTQINSLLTSFDGGEGRLLSRGVGGSIQVDQEWKARGCARASAADGSIHPLTKGET